MPVVVDVDFHPLSENAEIRIINGTGTSEISTINATTFIKISSNNSVTLLLEKKITDPEKKGYRGIIVLNMINYSFENRPFCILGINLESSAYVQIDIFFTSQETKHGQVETITANERIMAGMNYINARWSTVMT